MVSKSRLESGLEMLGRNRQKKMSVNRVSTVIGQGTEIHGDIVISGGLHVDGTVKGNIHAQGDSKAVVSLSEIGAIEGEVSAPTIFLNGAVQGNVFSSTRIELASKSKVIGDVTYNLIEMAVGAEVNGQLVHIEDQESKLRMENVSSIRLKKEMESA